MRKIFLTFMLILPYAFLSAQEEVSSYKYWFTAGAWIDRDVNSIFSYSFSLDENFFRAAYTVHQGFSIMGGSGNIPAQDGYFYRAVDVSFGKRLQTEWFQLNLFTGPSVIWGQKQLPDYSRKSFVTGGMRIDMQALFRLADEIGFGIGLYENINFERSIAGINLLITMGNGK